MGRRIVKRKQWKPIVIALLAAVIFPVGVVGLIYFDWVESGRESESIVVEEIEDSGAGIKTEPQYDATPLEEAVGLSKETSKAVTEIDDGEKDSAESQPIDDLAEQILERMTLYEKICQMFIVTPEQLTGVSQVTASGETTKRCLSETPVSGIIYLQPNLQNYEQTKAMLFNVQEIAMEVEGIPLFLCVDEEGGRVLRIGGNEAFGIKKALPMADITSKAEAHTAGSYIGSYLSDLGFNVDLAPVCDVLTNPDNQVIGNRSFGSDADIVRDYAREFSNGLREHGILSTYKHFPGHGATADDTHEGFAYTDKSLDELLENELIPFADADNAGADMVMVSHISVPKILGEDSPCSLSYFMVTEVLKQRLGYSGLVVTDAMNMGAITDTYEADEAVVMAIKAGNDLILAPENLESAINEVMEKVNLNEIDEEQINSSVKRIILKKLSLSGYGD